MNHIAAIHFCIVADSGGFEPPTARFVAEYSIQLSYESTKGAHYRFVIIPVKLFDSMNHQIRTENPTITRLCINGGEGGIRTPDTLLRCTPLAGERLRPLGHLSATRGASYPSSPRPQSQKLQKN